MKSKELKTYNLPKDDLLISSIDAKPGFLFLLLSIFGILLLFFESFRLYGVSILVITLITYLYLPKVTLMEFFQDYLVLYNRADNNTCVLVYYDEVVSWNYTWSANRDYPRSSCRSERRTGKDRQHPLYRIEDGDGRKELYHDRDFCE